MKSPDLNFNQTKMFFTLSGVSLVVGSFLAMFLGFQSFIVAGLILIGLIGLFVFQSERMGWFERVSYFLAGLGIIIIAGISFLFAFVDLGYSSSLSINIGDISSSLLFFGITGMMILGYVLMAVANMRTKMLPAFSNTLLLVGTVSIILMGDIGRYILCCGLIWQGIFLIKVGVNQTVIQQ